MIYSPYKLQLKMLIGGGTDNLGRPLPSVHSWVDISSCRCDDNSVKEFHSANGEIYRPAYKVVCEKNDLKRTDEIRCLNRDLSIRGEGKIHDIERANLLNYSIIWI